MRIYISADMEGITGLVDRDDVQPGGRDYERGRRMMALDVNAAVAGAVAAGASDVLVNDAHGHDVGDRVLQELSGRIRACIRNVDICCRIGGEEFVIVLPATDLDVAERIAERMRQQIAGRRFNVGVDGGLAVTVSIGVATLSNATDRAEEILKRADTALYRAKREGRNRTMVTQD